jgi:hypothetical protein
MLGVGPATQRVRETNEHEFVEKRKRGRKQKTRDGSHKEQRRRAIVLKGEESSGINDDLLFGTRDASQ